MTIRKLTEKDKNLLYNLINNIEANLEDKTFWLPIKDKAKENFFNENWTLFYGAFKDDKLIGACALFFNEYEYGETLSYLKHIPINSCAEIGRCMVHPDYRGNNIMQLINAKLIKEAKKRNINYILATAHPKNFASNISFEKLNFKSIKTIVKENIYSRNIWLLNLDEKTE
ncbi:MAG: GNAT family N-acetyltransferase [Clostridiales bacterium]|nr:GNAT family N-acetyltransferase [Clostridiales bacterium]